MYLWHSTGTLPVLCVCVVVVPPYPSPAGVVVVADGTGPSGEDDSTLPWWLCMSIGAVGEYLKDDGGWWWWLARENNIIVDLWESGCLSIFLEGCCANDYYPSECF